MYFTRKGVSINSSTNRRIEQLEKEVDALTLICMSMWELLGQSSGFFQKDLEAKIQEIDLRDGKLDGKYSAAPESCPSCGHKLGPRRHVCVYCGSSVWASKG